MLKVVTRFAPSPTGSPHLGSIRTAIFAYLWAKHNNGKFLLRIEDTDRERLVEGAAEEIEDSLRWLGLNYDDEKIFQSDRKEVHKKHAEDLLATEKAYKCFCTKERLEKLRKGQESKKIPPGYDKHCRNLSKKEIAEFESNKTPFVIRLAMPEEGNAEWEDLVRGKMSVEYTLSDDQILVKSDGWPTYHLASVVDDHDQGVTDVIRGEEWLPSTPKHIALYEAFRWSIPRFAHLPVIIGKSGGKKLSKRDGDTAVSDYMKNGYLPEAMVNFLALLGWNPGTTEEIFNMDELVKKFDLCRVQKSPAVFDIEKLDWLNGQYIRKTQNSKLKAQIKAISPKSPLAESPIFDRILEVEKSRLATLTDITKDTEYFGKSPKINAKMLVFGKSTKESTLKGLEATQEAFSSLSEGTWQKMEIGDFEAILMKVVESEDLSNGDVFWPVRVALSGREKSPSPAELLWVFGKEEALKRIEQAIGNL